MENLSLKQKRKSRLGPNDFKRNLKAKRDGDKAIGIVFISLLVSMVFLISYL